MKKVILIFSVAIVAAVVFNSCKKDNTLQPLKNGVSAKDKAITMKIVNFKNKLLSYKDKPNVKDGQVMPVDSAVWYSEALLNYSYDAGKGMKNFTTVSDSIEVPSVNGQITYADLYTAYTQLETLLGSQKNENPDKSLILADVASKGENGGNTTLVLISGFGDDLGGGTPPTNIWYKDAATIIKNAINANTPQPVNGYYIDITSIQIDPVQGYSVNGQSYVPYNLRNPNDPPTLDNWYDYLIFENTSQWPIQNYHMYLIPAEMTFYTNNANTICNTTMYTLVPAIAGKNFIGMNAEGWLMAPPDYTVIFHHYYLNYGTVVYYGGGN